MKKLIDRNKIIIEDKKHTISDGKLNNKPTNNNGKKFKILNTNGDNFIKSK